MAVPRALILRAPGANCDLETQFGFEQAGAIAERVHINRLREQPSLLQRYQILVVPGGFTYGDDVAAGKILATQLAHFLGDSLRRFRDADKLILGICNGFQALLKAGLLVPPDEEGPLATLAHNEAGKFEDRWIYLEAMPGKCPFLTGCERLHVPVLDLDGGDDGKVVIQGDQGFQHQRDGEPQPHQPVPEERAALRGHLQRQVRDRKAESQGDVAGICDVSGRVLGVMPHPERHVLPAQHPRWTRTGLAEEGDGLRLFRNAVNYFQED